RPTAPPRLLRVAHVFGHMDAEAFERLVHVQRSAASIDLEPELDARTVRRAVDTEADRCVERVRFRTQDLHGLAGSDRTLHVDRRRLAELDRDAEFFGDGRVDDL